MKSHELDYFCFVKLDMLRYNINTEDARFVTCGSAIRIRNIDSRKYFLGSSEHQYSHNGQQVVTLDTRGDQSKFMWQVSLSNGVPPAFFAALPTVLHLNNHSH